MRKNTREISRLKYLDKDLLDFQQEIDHRYRTQTQTVTMLKLVPWTANTAGGNGSMKGFLHSISDCMKMQLQISIKLSRLLLALITMVGEQSLTAS